VLAFKISYVFCFLIFYAVVTLCTTCPNVTNTPHLTFTGCVHRMMNGDCFPKHHLLLCVFVVEAQCVFIRYDKNLLCSWSGRPARPRTQHGYHHDKKVKPEAATSVIELLVMGGKTPETC